MLPELYARWMDQLLGGHIPAETRATCDDCAMLSGQNEPVTGPEGSFFDQATKCCTFTPNLPNFLIGQILSDEDPSLAAGQAVIRKRLQGDAGVMPRGLARPPGARLPRDKMAIAFGRSLTLLCPYYLRDEGMCGIWAHRDSICATWFCKHNRGAAGKGFWEAVRRLLSALEYDLEVWCMLELDAGSQAFRTMFSSPGFQAPATVGRWSPDTVPHRAVLKQTWGRWMGREEEFYGQCDRLVRPLTWNDVTAICGPRVRALARLVVADYGKILSNDAHPRLQCGKLNVTHMTDSGFQVCTYSPYDPLLLSGALFHVLHYFDGRPTDEAISAIASEQGIEFDRRLGRKLADFQVLVPVSRSGRLNPFVYGF